MTFLVGCKSAGVKEGTAISVSQTNAEKGLMDCFVLYSDMLKVAKKENPLSEDASRFEKNMDVLGSASNFVLKDNGRTQDQIGEMFNARVEYVWVIAKDQDSLVKLYNDCETIVLPSATQISEINYRKKWKK